MSKELNWIYRLKMAALAVGLIAVGLCCLLGAILIGLWAGGADGREAARVPACAAHRERATARVLLAGSPRRGENETPDEA